MENKPLITIILLTYNQEPYVAEAVKGVLSQTYSPLEIILSDDCSTDSSFDIMRDIVSNYTGPHSVQLNKNDKNMGVCAHFNKAFSMASGALIVEAGGDDVSLPNRVSRLFEYWENHDHPICIFSSMTIIDVDGKECREFISKPQNKSINHQILFLVRGGSGASCMFSRIIIDTFGPLPANLTFEDRAICFRSFLLGETPCYTDESLVLYRYTGNNLALEIKQNRGSKHDLITRNKLYTRNIALLQSFLTDLNTAHARAIISDSSYHINLYYLCVSLFNYSAFGFGQKIVGIAFVGLASTTIVIDHIKARCYILITKIRKRLKKSNLQSAKKQP